MKYFNSTVVLRITALWAFSEAFLGGILHGFKVPFAGLALSLIAALCMSMMAVCGEKRGAILRATLIVLAIKFILSPHTPPMAYVAVMIEGLAGELFFLQRRFLRTASFFLSLFCLVYSAFQHLLVLTVLFGKQFWEAMDIFLNGITKNFVKQPQQYSLYLVVFYISCYVLAGIAGGLLSRRIILRIQKGQFSSDIEEITRAIHDQHTDPAMSEVSPKKKKGNTKLIMGILLLVLLAVSYTPLFQHSLLKSKITEVIVRGVLILLVWNFFISPLLVRWIGHWVHKYKKNNNSVLQQVIALLPDIKKIVQICWIRSANKANWKRIPSFLSNTMMLIVYAR